MAEIWKDGDSARTMTRKYNDTAKEVESLKGHIDKELNPIPEEIKKLQEQVDKKIESVTKADIGLGEVDNTADINKPVSIYQQQAINRAVEGIITSQPASEIEDSNTTFITGINVTNTKLILTY